MIDVESIKRPLQYRVEGGDIEVMTNWYLKSETGVNMGPSIILTLNI